MRLRHAAMLLCLATATPAAFAAAPPADDAPGDILQPMDVFQLQWANNPRLSPDGKTIVYERTFFDVMKDTRRANLWQLDVASGNERPLTTGATRDGQATWSPDGRRVAYVAADGDKPQVFVRWMATGEVARITQLPYAPNNLSWSPDGKWLAFTMRVAASPDAFASMPKAPDGAQWASAPKVIDSLIYRFDGGGYREPGHDHLFIVRSTGGAARQVTQGDHDFDGAPSWLPDSRAVIVAGNLGDEPEFDPIESELYRIDIADGRVTPLTTRDGPDQSPVVSPDGKHVAYVGFDDRRMGYHNTRLYVLDLASGKSRALTDDVDLSIEDPQWDGNGGLFVSYDKRGRSRIGWIDADGGAIRELTDEYGGTAMGRPYGGGAMSASAGRVAFTRGTEYLPADVAIVARDGKPRVLTDLSSGLLDHRTLGRVEEITYASGADQREVQAWIVYPPHFDKSKKYPLMLEIHGGPFENYGPRFAPETQLYAAKGYVVLYVNPRGSTSYGDAFANLIHHNYPSQDYDDLMSGVDAVIARGNIDEKNLFVTGGSGGGVLTAWIVGHTNRFTAAVVAKPVINWYSFVLTSDFYAFFNQYWFAAPPWEDPEPYIKRSPITYVGNVRTPTMLISGESDYRTPISEAEQYYQALRLRKVPTALVRIPGASHSINARPSQMIAQVVYTIGWFEKYRAK